MARKISLVVIKNNFNNDINKVTKALHIKKYEVTKTQPLQDALTQTNLSIGFYKDYTFIASSSFLVKCFNKQPDPLEKMISTVFKNDEVLILGELQGFVNGFSLLKNGQRARTFFFDSEINEQIVDIGLALNFESSTNTVNMVSTAAKSLFNIDINSASVLITNMTQIKVG